MSIFEQTPRGGSRFGKFSSNMFFIRNTAKPKRVRHIEGLNGALICNVNDDPSLIRSSAGSSLSFNRTNLPTIETPRRVERLVPPTGFWNTHGIIQDTERWKQELAALATASGLGVEKDEQIHSNKPSQTTATTIEQKYSNKPPQSAPTATDQQHASRSGAHYSTRTGRFNEGTAKSRGRTGSKHSSAHPDILFNVPENERDMWMLQVLCQLLNTSNLEEIQSWLVSASQAEKDQARYMINSALRGLKESERTSDQLQQSVDLNSLSSFVERQKNEEKYASQKYIKETLNRSVPGLQLIDEEQQTDIDLNDSLDVGTDVNSNVSQNTATYTRTYQNHNQRSQTSMDGSSSNKKTDLSNENNNEEQIDTIQLNDDRRQTQSASLIKPKKISTKPETPLGQPPSSHKQKHRHQVESMQFNDDDINQNLNNNISENADEHQQQKETKQSLTQDIDNNDNNKSRKIRQLQHKLSAQAEETKKKFDELQSKQSRLENAIKLLVKQTATAAHKKRRQQTNDNTEEAPIVNVIIQSPRETNGDRKSNKQQESSSSIQTNGKLSKKNRNGNDQTKLGEYTIDDVKVQISLSRLDNHSAKVYSGVWKPDASTLHRLKGN